MVIKTDRMLLRPLQATDEEAIFALRNHPEVLRYIDRQPDLNRKGTREFITWIESGQCKGKWYYWGISLPTADRVIGTICLWRFNADRTEADLGYELHPDYHGMGLMTQAAERVLAFGFHVLGLHKISAFTHGENEGSLRLLKRLGFQFTAPSYESVIYSLGVQQYDHVYRF